MLSGEFGEAQELLMIKIVTDEMGLDIEDELARQGLGSRARQFGFARLGRCNLEHVRAIDLVHSDERRGHAATRLHELPSAQAKSLAVFLGPRKSAARRAFASRSAWAEEIRRSTRSGLVSALQQTPSQHLQRDAVLVH